MPRVAPSATQSPGIASLSSGGGTCPTPDSTFGNRPPPQTRLYFLPPVIRSFRMILGFVHEIEANIPTSEAAPMLGAACVESSAFV